MAEPTKLIFNVLDSPILEQTSFGDDMKNWLSNTVDIINSAIMTVDNIFLNVLDIATASAVISGGPTPLPFFGTVPVLGLTPPNGFVVARIVSTTNPGISIVDIVVGVNQFTVEFSDDPGASAIIAYQAYSQNPQG